MLFKLAERPPLAKEPVVAQCRAEAAAAELIRKLGGGNGAPPQIAGEPDDDHPISSNGARVKTRPFVNDHVRTLMSTVTSPEEKLLVNLDPQRATLANTEHAVDTFQLRAGASDVTSYHDFNTLQIAFRHVWTEVFDHELKRMGQELFEEYVRLKDFTGLDDGKDDPISTVDDLSRLIGEIKDLSRITSAELPGGKSTGRDGTARDVPGGAKDLRDNLVYDVLTGGFIEDDALRWILNPAGAAVDFLGDLFAGKQQVSWSSFGSDRTLPGGIDVISTTFEENAVDAGTVEIVLTTSADAATWKGIDFTELDQTGRPLNVFKIANDPRDRGVWDPNNYNRLPLYTQQIRNGILDFGKEIMFGAHKAHYFLIGLDEKLKDRTRVTFNWEKDK
jgi:hypothetical protein